MSASLGQLACFGWFPFRSATAETQTEGDPAIYAFERQDMINCSCLFRHTVPAMNSGRHDLFLEGQQLCVTNITVTVRSRVCWLWWKCLPLRAHHAKAPFTIFLWFPLSLTRPPLARKPEWIKPVLCASLHPKSWMKKTFQSFLNAHVNSVDKWRRRMPENINLNSQ